MWWNDVIPTQGLRLEDCKFEISLNNLDPAAKTTPQVPVLCHILDVGLGTHLASGPGLPVSTVNIPWALALPPRSPGHHLRIAALVIPMSPRLYRAVLVPLSGAATARALYSRQ